MSQNTTNVSDNNHNPQNELTITFGNYLNLSEDELTSLMQSLKCDEEHNINNQLVTLDDQSPLYQSYTNWLLPPPTLGEDKEFDHDQADTGYLYNLIRLRQNLALYRALRHYITKNESLPFGFDFFLKYSSTSSNSSLDDMDRSTKTSLLSAAISCENFDAVHFLLHFHRSFYTVFPFLELYTLWDSGLVDIVFQATTMYHIINYTPYEVHEVSPPSNSTLYQSFSLAAKMEYIPSYYDEIINLYNEIMTLQQIEKTKETITELLTAFVAKFHHLPFFFGTGFISFRFRADQHSNNHGGDQTKQQLNLSKSLRDLYSPSSSKSHCIASSNRAKAMLSITLPVGCNGTTFASVPLPMLSILLTPSLLSLMDPRDVMLFFYQHARAVTRTIIGVITRAILIPGELTNGTPVTGFISNIISDMMSFIETLLTSPGIGALACNCTSDDLADAISSSLRSTNSDVHNVHPHHVFSALQSMITLVLQVVASSQSCLSFQAIIHFIVYTPHVYKFAPIEMLYEACGGTKPSNNDQSSFTTKIWCFDDLVMSDNAIIEWEGDLRFTSRSVSDEEKFPTHKWGNFRLHTATRHSSLNLNQSSKFTYSTDHQVEFIKAKLITTSEKTNVNDVYNESKSNGINIIASSPLDILLLLYPTVSPHHFCYQLETIGRYWKEFFPANSPNYQQIYEHWCSEKFTVYIVDTMIIHGTSIFDEFLLSDLFPTILFVVPPQHMYMVVNSIHDWADKLCAIYVWGLTKFCGCGALEEFKPFPTDLLTLEENITDTSSSDGSSDEDASNIEGERDLEYETNLEHEELKKMVGQFSDYVSSSFYVQTVADLDLTTLIKLRSCSLFLSATAEVYSRGALRGLYHEATNDRPFDYFSRY